ncbi:MAG: energy-coupling factor ABC transporter permease [Rhodobacteraceae bacterium]|nr:energy-coupling factor ABC transporter permease [Paracoccaceae bacterium]
MHIEPGVVTGAKLALSYATATGAGAWVIRHAIAEARSEGLGALALRTAVSAGLVFAFFEILPHFPVGVSEVHLIFGSTLFLIFGAAPAALGLALGLLIQGLFFAPFDLPQYGMNVTTLIVPLLAVRAVAHRLIANGTPYVDLKYREALALSVTYQGGVVLWVGFWALYGHGLETSNLAAIASFGAAYMSVILIEPLADLGVLAAAKALHGLSHSRLVQTRVHTA